MAAGVKVHIDLSGPLFQRDPSLTVKGNIRRMMQGLAGEGERMTQEGWTNSVRGRRGVVGRTKSLSGNPWTLVAVITPTFIYPWPGSGVRQYRGGKNKMRKRAFGAAAGRMRASRAVLVANLTEGIE